MAGNVNELRNGAFIKEGKEIFSVVTYEHIKTGRGSGNIKLKVRNLKTGAVTEKSYITGARVEEADVEKKKAQYLYKDSDAFYFMDPQTFEQFPISTEVLGQQAKFLIEGLEVILIVGEGVALAMELPLSLIYTISDTGPAEKGNTVSNVFKDATLDNGLMVKVPMFSKIGDKIKVDTRSGQYVERVK
ncbi:MAG: elongation factor P [Candidatus Daviesbacteria bacterium]|nr:elongation factor P [Candidatus Daviesbacteria bacterium]